MSAWLASETHIRALVTAMAKVEPTRMVTLPPVPQALLDCAPDFFRPLAIAQERNGALPVVAYEDLVGAALTLANVLALRARYPSRFGPADEAQALTYRYEPVTVPAVSLLKQFACWAHQCAEDNDAAADWASAVERAMTGWLISQIPEYDAAPWGLN